jgi:hypothetical protein
VKWDGKYGRKVSWNVNWYRKYGEEWKDLENTGQNCEKYENFGKYARIVFSFTKQLILHVIYLSLHYAL